MPPKVFQARLSSGNCPRLFGFAGLPVQANVFIVAVALACAVEKAVKAVAPISFGRVLYGVMGLSIVGLFAGVVFAWIYNAINRR